jgi:hypothetical protein
MATTSSTAVPFAQGQDLIRLRAAVDRSSQEIKDYTREYEDQHAIVDALDAAEHADPRNNYLFNILTIREDRLDAARIRKTAALALLSKCLIAHSSAAQAQAAATVAAALPAATTTPLTTTTAEKKVIKRKLPEPRDGWKDSASKLHRAHSDAMSYHKAISAILWQITDIGTLGHWTKYPGGVGRNSDTRCSARAFDSARGRRRKYYYLLVGAASRDGFKPRP